MVKGASLRGDIEEEGEDMGSLNIWEKGIWAKAPVSAKAQRPWLA